MSEIHVRQLFVLCQGVSPTFNTDWYNFEALQLSFLNMLLPLEYSLSLPTSLRQASSPIMLICIATCTHY